MTRQLGPILALLGGMVFLMLGGGLQGILISIRGELEGFTAFQLGWIGTGWAVGFTVGCILVPHLVRRVGHVRTFSTLTAMLSISILLNALIVEAISWIGLRAISGFCFAGCYMVAESWLNERVTNDQRGRLFSIYAITTMVAMAAGQFLLVTAEPQRETLFMIGAILYALAILPTAVSKAQSPAPLTNVNLDIPSLFRNSPAAAFGAFCSGIISSSWTNFGPIFGQQIGMTSTMIATLVSLALVGSIIFQYPLGRLSDFVDRRYVMAFAGLLGAGAGTFMTYLAQSGSFGVIFYIALLGYGGVIYSIYGLAVAHANDHAGSDNFVKTSSGLLLVYGAGTMIGPLFAASLMDQMGPWGVFTTTTIAHIAFGGYAFYRTFRREKVEDEERVDFQTVALTRTNTPESYQLDPRANPDAFVLTEEDDLPPMPPPVKVE